MIQSSAALSDETSARTSGAYRVVAISICALTFWGLSTSLIAGPFDEPAMHDAPRGPAAAPSPNPPAQPPSEVFFRQLIQNRAEGNFGGRTQLITITGFSMGAPRQATPAEMQPKAIGATVTPILVQWTATSYGQTDTTTQAHEQTWICWKDETGAWTTGATGMSKDGPINSKDHPSVP